MTDLSLKALLAVRTDIKKDDGIHQKLVERLCKFTQQAYEPLNKYINNKTDTTSLEEYNSLVYKYWNENR